MTQHTVLHTRPARQRRPGGRGALSWQLPSALVVLSLIPVIAGSLRRRPGQDAPANYELRIEGHLDQHWSARFGGLTLTREDDGTTTLRGAVTDQAELHGLLAKVRDLGATLISVKTIDAQDRRHGV
jgi:hypothetical protein